MYSGEHFQTDYTHEIPKEYSALFKRMCADIPDDMTTLSKADWLLANPDTSSRHSGYNEWATSRTSFTIRFFK